MGITEIIREIDALELVDRKRLMSHLVLRRLQENESYRNELADRLQDKKPENWTSADELKEKLRKEE